MFYYDKINERLEDVKKTVASLPTLDAWNDPEIKPYIEEIRIEQFVNSLKDLNKQVIDEARQSHFAQKEGQGSLVVFQAQLQFTIDLIHYISFLEILIIQLTAYMENPHKQCKHLFKFGFNEIKKKLIRLIN